MNLSSRKKDILVISLALLAVTYSCLPLFKNISKINLNWDWLQMLSYYRADRISLLQYHQAPLRTFYFGGGYPLIANPQDGFLSPFFIPVLIFGEVIGLKINVFLMHIIAALGMYYLTKSVLKYNYAGALFSVFIFCLGGYMHRLLIRGQGYISPLYSFFIPLIFAFFIKSREHRKYLFYSILVLTIMVTQAGLYFLPTVIFLFLFSCAQVFKYEDKRFTFDISYLSNFFIIILFVFLLGAVKILPMLELLRQNPRLAEGYTAYSQNQDLVLNIYKAFMTHQMNLPDPWQWRYFYVGYLPIIFSLLSFIIFWRETKKYLFLLIVFMLLSFGAHTSLDLFKLVSGLPIFSSIYHPTRYFVPFVIFILAVTSGQFFSLPEKLKKKLINPILAMAIIITVIDLLRVNTAAGEAFPITIPQPKSQLSLFYVQNLHASGQYGPVSEKIPVLRSWEMTRPTQYELMLQNIGKINWYGNIHLGEYAAPKYYVDWNGEDSLDPKGYTWGLNPEYRGEIYFLNNPDNKAEFSYFGPNKIIVKVNVVRPDVLVINQNYDKYWKSDYANTINHNGLLAIKLDKTGDSEIKFNYVPVSFYLGLAVSLGTVILIVYWFLRI